MSRSVAAAAVIIMLGNIAGRLLGLAREQTVGALLGTSSSADAFRVAYKVPTMVYDLLIGGALTAALVPVFSDYAGPERRERLGQVAGAVLTAAGLALLTAVLVLIALARPLMWLLAGGRPPEVQAEAAVAVRWMLPSVLFLGLSSVLMAVLYALRRYTAPAFCVATYNAGIVLLGVVLGGRAPLPALLAGILLGAIAQVVVQLPALRDVPLRPALRLRDPAVQRITHLYVPVFLGLVLTQIMVVIDSNLASHTGEGSIASLGFATTLIQFPLGLTASALSFATLPVLSRAAGAASDAGEAEYQRTLRASVRVALLLIVPAMVLLVLLRVPVVRLLFERGRFDEASTASTALAFLFYSPQLPFTAVDQLFIAAYYARKNTRTPVLVGVAGVFIYLAAALTFLGPLQMGMPGLALANAVQNSAHAIILGVLLQRTGCCVFDRAQWSFVARIALAALVCGTTAWAAAHLVTPLSAGWPRLFADAAVVAAAGTAGMLAYVLALQTLRVRELGLIVAPVLQRLGLRQPAQAAGAVQPEGSR
jgi:putative peptidoglycan lipid II flippase